MTVESPTPQSRFAPEPLTLGRGRRLSFDRTLVMAVVNVTPDSFFAASRAPDTEAAVERALADVADGADIIDVGGESTRPGSEPVPADVESQRVVPVIEGIRKHSAVAISVDTSKFEVARAALDVGADIVNDVTGLSDRKLGELIAARGAACVLMHMRGDPRTMQEQARYHDVVLEVKAELGARIAAAKRAGIPTNRQWLDPGIGFAKKPYHNLELLRRLEEFQVFERPLLIGVSRKSFLGAILDEPDPERRLEGSLAAAVAAALKGAHIVRVHDVACTARALRVVDAIQAPERFTI